MHKPTQQILKVARSFPCLLTNLHKYVPDMAVPPSSLIHAAGSQLSEPPSAPQSESLLLWRHSDGRSLGYNTVHIEMRSLGDNIQALVTEI